MELYLNIIHYYSNDHTALQITLYYDELEVCNPLGSRRKKHKLGWLVYSSNSLTFNVFFRCILFHAWKCSPKTPIKSWFYTTSCTC